MKIEHVAFLVADPIVVTRWYIEHLGMKVVRSMDKHPFTRFLADSAGAVMVEIYRGDPPVPDYRAMHSLVLHLAFATDDVTKTRERLIKAGATPEGDVVVTAGGDVLAMLRDPWGLAIQLAQRKIPML